MFTRRVVFVLAALLAAGSAKAMPNFTRKEGFDCSTCHINIPRLNRFGYEYRNSGFRVPSTIGDKKQKEVPNDFGTLNAARIQSNGQWRHQRDQTAARKTVNQGEITFLEATLYPVTGSWGRWWSSEGELSVAPEDFFEVENAWARFTHGGEAMRFNLRAGVFHPWEGYGASDRPVTLARPTFQGSAARGTFFTPWGFDQAGVEGGVTYGPFNITATVFNGITVHGSAPTGDDAYKAFPFQGGELVRSTNDPGYTSKDFQVFANQFFGDAALSAWWYHGSLTTPLSGAVGEAGSVTFHDRFDRVAVYGTLPIPRFAPKPVPEVWLLGGWERGWDRGAPTGALGSTGFFGEVYVPVNPYVGTSVRYDYWDSSTKRTDDLQHVVTAAVNVAALNGAQAIAQYRHVLTELNAVNNRNRDQFDLRLIYIF